MHYYPQNSKNYLLGHESVIFLPTNFPEEPEIEMSNIHTGKMTYSADNADMQDTRAFQCCAGWAIDPDGNRLELWEPPAEMPESDS